MAVPCGLIGQGRHAPIGTVDSTAMGPLGQAPIGSRRPTGGCLGALQQLADRSVARHQAGETSSQTSHRGHPAASSQGKLSIRVKADLRAAVSSGRPRAGNDTTVTQRPASPNAASWRSAPGPSHFRQASDGAMDSRNLGVGTAREALSQKLKPHRRVRGSSFGNGLEVGALLPGYRASIG